MENQDITHIPFYKKWWFGALVTFILMSIINTTKTSDSEQLTDSVSTTTTESNIDNIETNDKPEITDTESKELDEPEKKEFELIQVMLDTPLNDIKAVIKNKAEEEWGTDFNMVKYEYNKQFDAYEEIMQIVNHPDLGGTIDELLIEEALAEWGINFNMVMYEYNKQLDAWIEMQNN